MMKNGFFPRLFGKMKRSGDTGFYVEKCDYSRVLSDIHLGIHFAYIRNEKS